MKSTEDLNNFISSNPNLSSFLNSCENDFVNMDLSKYLKLLLTEKKMIRADVINKTILTRAYAYEIFSGRKSPTRNKILQLCFGFSLNIEEANHLLTFAGLDHLYAKKKRDSIISLCLLKNNTLLECNCYLEEVGEKTID